MGEERGPGTWVEYHVTNASARPHTDTIGSTLPPPLHRTQFTHLLYPGVTGATFGALLSAIHPELQEGRWY